MLTLNLVAPALKKENKHRQFINLLKKACNLSIILALAISLYAFSGWLVIYDNYTDTIKKTGLGVTESESYDDKVASINTQINMIADIQKNYYPLSNIIHELMRTIAPGITLTSVKLDRSVKTLDLQGLAFTRDDLLKFKDNLSASDMFDEIDLPISNILKKDNVTFEISAKLIL